MKKIDLAGLILMLSIFVVSTFVACNDDDNTPSKPAISITEVGHGSVGKVNPGTDLHLEADIVALGGIKRIDIEIVQTSNNDFKIVQSYTEGKYINVKNTEFHEHIDIPANAPHGEYHLHFTVTDNLGQQTTEEAQVFVVDEELPDDGD